MFAPSSLLLLPALGMRLGSSPWTVARSPVAVLYGVASILLGLPLLGYTAAPPGNTEEGARTEFGDLGLTAKEEKRLWPVGPKLSAELYRTTLL
jgi:hypothetical protein